ncbi:hypothetical protein JHJ32_10630 [Parapedobacter sp. ISTM3]|uniref:hypothetical protein n=1 Tax=Parapedobacter sp. ISTM3 TaxID=2800130 RepID=UPI001907CF94|nr:hypothetical protein [Parapedobacter sp. ISTM3]MBK1440441.1 hypothetical protein [Parapedobacter sp. ISTM3]
MRQIIYVCYALVVCSLLTNHTNGQERGAFGEREAKGSLSYDEIKEASGLVASVRNPGNFWTHNDSGDHARIFLINDSAQLKKTCYLKGVVARDWEDIGIMRRHGTNYIIVGDIGDNKAQYPYVAVHIFEEPKVTVRSPVVDTIPPTGICSIILKYEDGPRDAESLFFDPQDERLYIISKRELSVGVYYTDLPSGPVDTLVLKKAGNLPLTFATSAAISADGQELLVKNLVAVFYWKRKPGETIPDMLKRPAVTLPYIPEPQGEAIAFSREGDGYYTLSERPLGMAAILYFYKRL